MKSVINKKTGIKSRLTDKEYEALQKNPDLKGKFREVLEPKEVVNVLKEVPAEEPEQKAPRKAVEKNPAEIKK